MTWVAGWKIAAESEGSWATKGGARALLDNRGCVWLRNGDVEAEHFGQSSK